MSEPQQLNSDALLDHPDAAAAGAGPVPSAGAQLSVRRQAEGWSVEQVAAQLKLAPRQIEAIEADRLDVLPSIMIARGFIRSYARLLKMDPAPLLATIAVDMPSPIDSIGKQQPLSTPFSEARLPSMHPRSSRIPAWGVGLLALVLLGGGAWGVLQMNGQAGLPGPLLETLGARQEQAPLAPVGNDEVQTVAAVGEVPAPVVTQPETPASGSAAVPAVASVQADAVPVAAPVTAPPAPAVTEAPVVENNSLSLVLHQDSWIEIKRRDSSVMVSRLAKAGTVETFEIVEPVSLVVGNVGGVEASLRNVPLDLKSITSSNVARINLK